jgi:hypothetical protein
MSIHAYWVLTHTRINKYEFLSQWKESLACKEKWSLYFMPNMLFCKSRSFQDKQKRVNLAELLHYPYIS